MSNLMDGIYHLLIFVQSILYNVSSGECDNGIVSAKISTVETSEIIENFVQRLILLYICVNMKLTMMHSFFHRTKTNIRWVKLFQQFGTSFKTYLNFIYIAS